MAQDENVQRVQRSLNKITGNSTFQLARSWGFQSSYMDESFPTCHLSSLRPFMLTFSWNIRDRSALWLALSFLLLVVVLATFFVVFRITYPTVQRAAATPQRIIILDPADPAALAIIHRAQDKSFALLPAENTNVASMAEITAFKPSFADAQMKLRAFIPSMSTTQHPQIFIPENEVLPKVPRRATLTPEASPRSILKAIVSSELSARAPSSSELSDIPLTDPHAVQYRIAVGANGQVITALPLSVDADAALMRLLHTAIMGLHFAPDPKTPRLWGTLSFRWEKPQP